MCGIFGALNREISEELADYCCDTLSHRGPDGRGVWFNSNKNCVLAHRRLSIIDLSSNAQQPMSYANKRYYITYNGEIYNYLEIKAELKNKGYEFNSTSDTEVILASYMEWGEDCVHKFNGMWSFAIFDQEENSLFLSRDRFGVKPLYYLIEKNSLVFASEMKAIIPCMSKVEFNHSLISFFKIFHHYEFKEDCLIKNIKRFPAGSNAIFKNGKLTIKKYWHTLEHRIEVSSKYEEQAEQFRSIFFDACKIRMRSDVTIGTALSGGLDSSAVICSMNNVARNKDYYSQKDWQHAYVACFEGTELDESNYAKIVSDYIGISNTTIKMKNDLSEDKLLRQAYLFEELWMNSQMPIMDIYAAERQDGTVVSVDGHGADEIFGGYDFNIPVALFDAKDKNEVEEVAKTIIDCEAIESVESQEELEVWLKNRNIKTKRRYLLDTLYKQWQFNDFDVKSKEFKKLDNLSKMLYIETHKKCLPTMLRNYDRNSMASGVEIRMPFLDYRVVSFAFSIPWNSKIRNGYTKAIVRDGLKNIIPDEITLRKDKKGFNAPINQWLRESKELYLDLVNSQDFLNSDLVKNPTKVKEKLIKFINIKNDNYVVDLINGQKLWMVINMYVWEKAMKMRL